MKKQLISLVMLLIFLTTSVYAATTQVANPDLKTKQNEVSVNLGSRNIPQLGNSVVKLIQSDIDSNSLRRTASGEQATPDQYKAVRDKIQSQLDAQGPSYISTAPPITLTNSEANILTGILNANNAQYVTFSITVNEDGTTKTYAKNPTEFAQVYQLESTVVTNKNTEVTGGYADNVLIPYQPQYNLGPALGPAANQLQAQPDLPPEITAPATPPGPVSFNTLPGSADPGQNLQPGALCPSA